MKKSNIHILTGGLGNQLFQVAAALVFSQDKELILDCALGKPRSRNHSSADIYEYNVESLIPHKPTHSYSKIASKVMGYKLRSSFEPKSFEKYPIFQFFVDGISSFIMTLHYRRFVKALAPKNLGYDAEFEVGNGSTVIIGYFQTYKWLSSPDIREKLRSLTLFKPSSQVESYRLLSVTEKPLVVHIRLGDYLLEESFGIPSNEYYRIAIDKQFATGLYNRLWLFSDNPEFAIQKIPSEYLNRVRVIEEVDHSPCATLEVMRFGLGYVLANSSFSWWGAFLSITSEPKVIGPSPWFAKGPKPYLIMNPTWESVTV